MSKKNDKVLDPVHPKAPYNEASQCYHGGCPDRYGTSHNNPKPMKKLVIPKGDKKW